jgi:hypothetical protein
VGKHAWNVFPLEAFGFLLGSKAKSEVYAALPCSKTKCWHVFDDRWAGIEENHDKACAVAALFNMEVVGLYASAEIFGDKDTNQFPIPTFIEKTSMKLFLLYQTLCCPGHSWCSYKYGHRWLERDKNYVVPRGIRIRKEINQKRILKEWHRVFGGVEWSNEQEKL